MTNGPTKLAALGAILATAGVLAACPAPDDPDREPLIDDPPAPVETRERVYEAELQEIEGSGVTGTVTMTIGDELVMVRVIARGLEPGQRVPQHVHANSTCDPAGGILLNLDNELAHPNEAPARGEHYPTADGDGSLDFTVSRPLTALNDAARQHEGTTAEELDLGNRVVNVHAPDMRPIACGPFQERPMAETAPTQPPR